jgi:hypothetical protein
MDINKITFLLGPQSSGKSTIAKVLCHCRWIEKRCYTNFEEESTKFDTGTSFVDGINEYYRFNGYFSNNSYILYEGNYIRLEYKDKKLAISRNQNKDYEYPKLCYIPAERNLVAAIPNLRKYNDTNDLILYFMYDWFEAREYLKEMNLDDIIERHVKYVFEKTNNNDFIYDSNDTKLELKDASSGLQSLIPLMTVSTYILEGVFNRYKPLSSEQKMQLKNANVILLNLSKQLDTIVEKRKKKGETGAISIKVEGAKENPLLKAILNQDPIIQDIIDSSERKFFYKRSDIYIEEPEQNLFPDAQQNFIYWLMQEMRESDQHHCALITTHSPFVLFSLNNCLIGGLAGEKLSKQAKKDMLSRNSWIDPKMVTVYEIHDGKLKTIQEESGLLMHNYLNQAYRKINKEYLTMLDYYED